MMTKITTVMIRMITPMLSTIVGLYALKVYARSTDGDGDGDGETRTNVHNYVVNVPSLEEDCLPFPEVFEKWSGVVDKDILEPRDGMLPPSQSVKFAIKLPTGKSLRYTCNQKQCG